MVCESIADWSNLFHLSTTLSDRKNFLRSELHLPLASFRECPLVLISLNSESISFINGDVSPLKILYISIRSARFRRSSRVQRLRTASLSTYLRDLMPVIILVN